MKLFFLVSSMFLGFCAAIFTGAESLMAVDVKPIKVTEKWAVVGVITSSNPSNDVAVLKNNETSKTYTVTVGDNLPSDYDYVLKEIKRRNVIVSDGQRTYTIGFVDVPATDESDDFQNSVRFIDNYYRGLAESPIELFNKERMNETAGTAAPAPIKNFGTLSDQAKSRFDFYNRPFEDQNQWEDVPENEEELSDYPELPVYYDQQEIMDYEEEQTVE